MYIPSHFDEFPYNSSIINKCNNCIENLTPIFLHGPNGSGKKSFCKLLLSDFDIFYISSNDLISSKNINSILDNIVSQNNITIITNKSFFNKAIIVYDLDMVCKDKRIINLFINFIKLKHIPIIFISHNNYPKVLNSLIKVCSSISFKSPNNKFMLKLINNHNVPKLLTNSIINVSNFNLSKLFNIIRDIKIHNISSIEKFIIYFNNYDEFVDSNLNIITYSIFNESIDINDINKYYENDKILLPLMIHENYLHNIIESNCDNKLKAIYKISESLVNGDIYEYKNLNEQSWELSNYHCIYSTYFPNTIFRNLKYTDFKLNFTSLLSKTSNRSIKYKYITNLYYSFNHIINDFHELYFLNYILTLSLHRRNSDDLQRIDYISTLFNIDKTIINKIIKIDKNNIIAKSI